MVSECRAPANRAWATNSYMGYRKRLLAFEQVLLRVFGPVGWNHKRMRCVRVRFEEALLRGGVFYRRKVTWN